MHKSRLRHQRYGRHQRSETVDERSENGGTLGIANKEPIVAAGRLLREQAERYGSTIIPVDSEHSAIFQCLKAGKVQDVKR